MSRGLAVKLRLRISEEFGPYDLHTDIKTMVHQNLKMIFFFYSTQLTQRKCQIE